MNKKPQNDTAAPKSTPLALAFEERDRASAELARVNSAIGQQSRDYEANQAKLDELTTKLGDAEAAALLDKGDRAVADELSEQQQAIANTALRNVATVRALKTRRDAVAEAVKDARLTVARELEQLAWPIWDSHSLEAVDHFTRFLDSVRKRVQLASTVTEAFRSAGETREPFNEESVERAKFLGEFGLTVEGLADLVSAAQLKMTQNGFGLLPAGSIQLLTEAELLALAEAAEAATE